MIAAPIPDYDSQRLKALRKLLILDTPPEERFDRIAQFARMEFDMPMALVSLVDRDRQWFKSNFGVEVGETPRDISFCGHAILERNILLVPDALKDERFHDNPLVVNKPWVRFYAGAVLRMPYGMALGTLCVMDTRPREMDSVDLAILGSLRDLVVEEMVRQETSEWQT
ncbi:MAG TPA: GAF domain-containing protein [Hydrogenophaga sp.]|uniref:GAF domain-containing protein n=1 Tax=Hydrogenophaga sp. TaxID=1904254 RepID=UPI002C95E82E|nr:GAF domain-containing protein [Hydrogenophaga sp.]HMN93910.1 GAF domain-containing protein [Hydrogenophaga sp.]HMP11512.1 GAF domain-containing protein [Hydrogenophaga sp.]